MTEAPKDEFADYIERVFPIPGLAFNDPVKTLEQFYFENIGAIKLVREPLTEWAQGDIIDALPFADFNDNGEIVSSTKPGIIASSSCDLDRKEKIVFFPCIRSDTLQALSSYNSIIKNKVFEFFYVGETAMGYKVVVDLNHPMSLPRERVLKNLELGRITRKHSLTREGWYLFITKFSMNYLRADDSDTMEKR